MQKDELKLVWFVSIVLQKLTSAWLGQNLGVSSCADFANDVTKKFEEKFKD